MNLCLCLYGQTYFLHVWYDKSGLCIRSFRSSIYLQKQIFLSKRDNACKTSHAIVLSIHFFTYGISSYRQSFHNNHE